MLLGKARFVSPQGMVSQSLDVTAPRYLNVDAARVVLIEEG